LYILGVCDFTDIRPGNPPSDGVSDDVDFASGEVGFNLIDGGCGGVEVEVESAGWFEGAFPVV